MKKCIVLMVLVLTNVSTAAVTIRAGEGPNAVVIDLKDEWDGKVGKVLEEYHVTTSELISSLGEPNLPDKAKVKIVYALGKLRALRATPVLIENINLGGVSTHLSMDIRIPPWGQYPAREALVRIGSYASTMIMKIIGSPKFDRAKVDGYATVIAKIETPRYALMKLDDRIAMAEDESVRQQYKAVKARIKEIAAQEKGVGIAEKGATRRGETRAKWTFQGGVLPALALGLTGAAVGGGIVGLILLLRRRAHTSSK